MEVCLIDVTRTMSSGISTFGMRTILPAFFFLFNATNFLGDIHLKSRAGCWLRKRRYMNPLKLVPTLIKIGNFVRLAKRGYMDMQFHVPTLHFTILPQQESPAPLRPAQTLCRAVVKLIIPVTGQAVHVAASRAAESGSQSE